MKFQSIFTVSICAVCLLFLPRFVNAEDAESRIDLPITDRSVAESIRADLDDAERVDRDAIDVVARDGLITLSGSVNSLLDKRLAERLAKQTRGVSAVMNQLIVRDSDRADQAIRDDVLKVLRLNQSVPRPKITVDVKFAAVSLLGSVNSLAEKRIAERAAAGVRGVREIDNQLSVAMTIERTDEELQEEIAGLLVHSVYLDDADLNVTVDDHVARLTGTVGSAAAKDQAIRVAEIWGITTVDAEEIEIAPARLDPLQRQKRYADVTDERIRQSIERVFWADPVVFSQADRIRVDIQSGVVELHGSVANLRAKRKAQGLVQGVVGVQRVVNELDVQPPEKPPSNEVLINHVQAAFVRSPYLQRHDVRVHCQRQHVSLYGVVESTLEREVAGWLASGIAGVVHVNNALAIDNTTATKNDEQIKKDLQRKLKFRLVDAASDIRVTVEDGVAVLSGEVDTWRQWQAAMDLALEAGARHPHNLINVRFHPPHGGSRIFVPE